MSDFDLDDILSSVHADPDEEEPDLFLEDDDDFEFSLYTPAEYVAAHFFWCAFTSFAYYRLVLVPIKAPIVGYLPKQTAGLILLGMVALSLLASYFLTRHDPDFFDIIAAITIPMLLFTFICMVIQHSALCLPVLALWLFAIGIDLIFILRYRRKFASRRPSALSRRKTVRACLFGVKQVTAIFSMAAMAIIAVASAFGHPVLTPAKMEIPRYADHLLEYQEKCAALQKELGKWDSVLISQDRWTELSMEDRVQLAQDVVNHDACVLGIPFEIDVYADDLPTYEDETHRFHTQGAYHPASHTIAIDLRCLEGNDPSTVIEIALHEVYHAWEHCLRDVYRAYLKDQIPREYANLQYLREAAVYYGEFANYEDGTDDYSLYQGQAVELDAEAHARSRISFYIPGTSELPKG